MKQCRAVTEEILAEPMAVALGTSHPEHYVRGYVEWLFSETDLYASLGQRTGPRAVEEVNAVIAKLLGLESTPPRLDRTPQTASSSKRRRRSKARTRLRRKARSRRWKHLAVNIPDRRSAA